MPNYCFIIHNKKTMWSVLFSKYLTNFYCYFPVWVALASRVELSSVPFLPVNPELSTMRNQGRQKLARFSPREFAALVIDMLSEAKRRQTPTGRYYRIKSKSSVPIIGKRWYTYVVQKNSGQCSNYANRVVL